MRVHLILSNQAPLEIVHQINSDDEPIQVVRSTSHLLTGICLSMAINETSESCVNGSSCTTTSDYMTHLNLIDKFNLEVN